MIVTNLRKHPTGYVRENGRLIYSWTLEVDGRELPFASREIIQWPLVRRRLGDKAPALTSAQWDQVLVDLTENMTACAIYFDEPILEVDLRILARTGDFESAARTRGNPENSEGNFAENALDSSKRRFIVEQQIQNRPRKLLEKPLEGARK